MVEIDFGYMFVVDVKTGERVGDIKAININKNSFKIESFVYSDGVFGERKEVNVEDILKLSDEVVIIK